MKTNANIYVLHAHPSQAALDSIVTLRLYSAGRADAIIARKALRRLEYIYGHPVKGAVALFERSLCHSDPSVRRELRFEALCHITDWVFHNPVKAAFWEQIMKVSRVFGNNLMPRLDIPVHYAARPAMA